MALQPTDYDKLLPEGSPAYQAICNSCVGNEEAPCCHNHPHDEGRRRLKVRGVFCDANPQFHPEFHMYMSSRFSQLRVCALVHNVTGAA